VALVVASLGAIMPGPADAQGFTTVRPGGRGGSWEFYLPIVYAESATITERVMCGIVGPVWR
jgi:hypothetical protein